MDQPRFPLLVPAVRRLPPPGGEPLHPLLQPFRGPQSAQGPAGEAAWARAGSELLLLQGDGKFALPPGMRLVQELSDLATRLAPGLGPVRASVEATILRDFQELPVERQAWLLAKLTSLYSQDFASGEEGVHEPRPTSTSAVPSTSGTSSTSSTSGTSGTSGTTGTTGTTATRLSPATLPRPEASADSKRHPTDPAQAAEPAVLPTVAVSTGPAPEPEPPRAGSTPPAQARRSSTDPAQQHWRFQSRSVATAWVLKLHRFVAFIGGLQVERLVQLGLLRKRGKLLIPPAGITGTVTHARGGNLAFSINSGTSSRQEVERLFQVLERAYDATTFLVCGKVPDGVALVVPASASDESVRQLRELVSWADEQSRTDDLPPLVAPLVSTRPKKRKNDLRDDGGARRPGHVNRRSSSSERAAGPQQLPAAHGDAAQRYQLPGCTASCTVQDQGGFWIATFREPQPQLQECAQGFDSRGEYFYDVTALRDKLVKLD